MLSSLRRHIYTKHLNPSLYSKERALLEYELRLLKQKNASVNELHRLQTKIATFPQDQHVDLSTSTLASQFDKIQKRKQNQPPVLIKSFRRQDCRSYTDPQGHPLSEAEYHFMTKNIDFRQWKWPETNPIKFKGLHFQNYRWPSS